jgi:hypothetical protein
MVNEAAQKGEFLDPQAFLIIEDWQQFLKKATLRIIYTDSTTGKAGITFERVVYLHCNRQRGKTSLFKPLENVVLCGES